MSNCIVAQSGGPSSVINATVAGVVKANQMNPVYEHVLRLFPPLSASSVENGRSSL